MKSVLEGIPLVVTANHTRLEVSREGAYVHSVQTDGSNILFPSGMLNQADGSSRLRGGLFVALPQFGPDHRATPADRLLPQHGYGRNADTLWDVLSDTHLPGKEMIFQSMVSVTHINNDLENDYFGLESEIHYQVLDSRVDALGRHATQLDISLALKNNSGSDMRVAPGLHPYFSVAEGDLDGDFSSYVGEAVTLEALEFADQFPNGLQFPSGLNIGLEVDEGYDFVTLWNGGDGNYLCVEPSAAGFSFEIHPNNPSPRELLTHGEVKYYAANYSISNLSH